MKRDAAQQDDWPGAHLRALTIVALALAAAGCGSFNPTRYDKGTFETASNASPVDRGTEFLRQIRNAEIEAEKQRAGEPKKKPPKLFKNQKDENEEKDDGV